MKAIMWQIALVALHWAAGILASPAASQVAAAEPAEFTPNTVGGGGTVVTDSPHFRVFGGTEAQRKGTIANLETAYTCFVTDLGWRSSGLSFNTPSNDGPWYKTNIYGREFIADNVAGWQQTDSKAGMAWFEVVYQYMATPVTVHEYGHGLTYHARNWVDQTRTGAWWETIANWFADTHQTSDLCANARAKNGISAGNTTIDLNKVIGDSHQVIVDGTSGSGNYYQAWPFITYLTNNPDGYEGLGAATVGLLFTQYKINSNETPLHTIERVSKGAPVQKLVGRYWARMAYVDLNYPKAQNQFLNTRRRINYANLDSLEAGKYRVKTARQPRYMGANIIPLKLAQGSSGAVTVNVTASDPFTATLAVRNTTSGAVRYVDLVNGSGSTSVTSTEEASLVVANTPATLILYDPFRIPAAASKGLDYQVTLSGATV